MGRDWIDWHSSYDDPASSMGARLVAVVDEVRRALLDAPPGPFRLASLCAGEGRDLTGALTGHPRSPDVDALLVELDSVLAARAQERLAELDVGARVLTQDAGSVDAIADVLPVDVLMLCGIFGNISDGDVQATIEAVPMLVRPGGRVIWTRHRREPDLIPSIRQWFDAAGCAASGFQSAGPGGWAVGAERFEGPAQAVTSGLRLFRFRDDLW